MINIIFTCDAAPVQAEGDFVFNNMKFNFYFRSRGGAWKIMIWESSASIYFEVKLPPEDYIIFEVSGWWGSDYDASYMPHKDSKELINSSIDVFIKSQISMIKNNTEDKNE